MHVRTEIEKRIEREQKKLVDFIRLVEHQESFIQGLQEAMKLVPREVGSGLAGAFLRPGSDMQKVQELLMQSGAPLHIAAILKGIGKEDTKPNRSSISGSMARYARRQEIFKRTGPNEFGLLNSNNRVAPSSVIAEDLPPYFGDEAEPIQPIA